MIKSGHVKILSMCCGFLLSIGFNQPMSAEHIFSKDDYVSSAMLALRNGKSKEALQLMTKAVAKDPSNPLLYVNRTTCYLQTGQVKKALADIKNAFILMKGHSYPPQISGYAYLNRGSVYLELKRDQEALNDFIQAAKIDPGNESAEWEMGKLYEKQGNKQLAIEHLRAAQQLYKAQGYPSQIIDARLARLEGHK